MKVRFREATEADLPAAVALMTDDILGQGREGADFGIYLEAFRAMAAEPCNFLIVGETATVDVVAVYQFTLMTGIAQKGLRRAQIEAIRVASDLRGKGIGKMLMDDAEDRARSAGARLLQLTTNRERDRTHAFYRRQGYVDTHLGFKKPL
ncbi:MAG: GNAT family N-acetyltransferase [Silicimonas sp.]|nr:GNAT family N-acetyltransferase [Silicimonas sp.]